MEKGLDLPHCAKRSLYGNSLTTNPNREVPPNIRKNNRYVSDLNPRGDPKQQRTFAKSAAQSNTVTHDHTTDRSVFWLYPSLSPFIILLVQHTLTYETSTIVYSPSQDPKPTLRRCTKPYLCSCADSGIHQWKWSTVRDLLLRRPGSACSAISYVGPRIMEFLQNPKSRSVGASHKELLHNSPKSKIQPKSLDLGLGNFGFWILGGSRECTTRQFSDGGSEVRGLNPPLFPHLPVWISFFGIDFLTPPEG